MKEIIIPRYGKIGYHDFTILESAKMMIVFGEYDTTKVGGGGDALHSFDSRKSDSFGGRMNSAIMYGLNYVYENGCINPSVNNLEIEISGKIVKWTATIGESTDGKIYLGFNSRGGASGNETKEQLFKRVDTQVNSKMKSLPKELGISNIEYDIVLDFYNPKLSGKSGIRQVFFQYTK
jgi:hypothetical protein